MEHLNAGDAVISVKIAVVTSRQYLFVQSKYQTLLLLTDVCSWHIFKNRLHVIG